jgi:RES domain-containing protein
LALPPDLPRSLLAISVFRVVREGLDPLATTGSLKAGGRFNPPGTFGVLYTSLDAKTAAQEVARGLRTRGIDPEQFAEGAWWVYELAVKLGSVLDFTAPDVLERSGVSENSLTGSDVNATRRIAAEARELGYEALVVPSAVAPGSKNLVIFLDRAPSRPIVLSSKPVRLSEKTG